MSVPGRTGGRPRLSTGSGIVWRRSLPTKTFPAFDLIRSGTRKEELLIPKANLNRVWILRSLLQEMNPVDAMEFIIGKIKKTETNQEFLDSMNS